MINRPMVLAAAGAGVVVFVIASFLVFSGLERTAATLTIVSSIGAVAAALYRRFSPPRRETRQLTAEQKTILIDTVRQRWIGVRDDDGRLKGDGQLARDLAFPNEYQLMVSRENARQQDATHTIVEAWRRAEGHMILTGAPGSGKSVQLRLLVEWLLDRA